MQAFLVATDTRLGHALLSSTPNPKYPSGDGVVGRGLKIDIAWAGRHRELEKCRKPTYEVATGASGNA